MKKAQSGGGAAALIAVITILIILYILFLPPDVREGLLNPEGNGTGNGGNGGNGGTTTFQKIVFRQAIGRLDYLSTTERTHDLQSFRIFSKTSGTIIKSVASLYAKTSLFGKDVATFGFTINKDSTNNVMMSFNAQKHSGRLIILLNGNEIFNNEINNPSPPPISLPRDYLQDSNEVKLTASGVGAAFWSVHEFSLSNIQVTADVTNYDNSQNTQHITVTSEEKNNIETATLWFYPECSKSGTLTISLNSKTIFAGTPDCGVNNKITLNINDINLGDNEIIVSTTGSYLIDNAKIKIGLKKLTYPVYYFDLDEDLFNTNNPDNARCGDVDGICPAGCDANKDKDCCFNENNYWCPGPTRNYNDRCVEFVDKSDCARCPFGYEDRSGNPPDNCKGLCGDDTDNFCPDEMPPRGQETCSRQYDKNCCYMWSQDNYWCGDVPFTGVTYTCTQNVNYYTCSDCPNGYVNGRGEGYSNCQTKNNNNEEENIIKSVDIRLTITFPDDSNKQADIIVNGHRFSINTNEVIYTRNIDDYARSNSNSIEIIPKSTMDITELKVEVVDV